MAFPASAAIPGTIHDRGLSQFPQSGFSVGPALAPLPQVCNTMVKALARAFRRRKQLDTGVHATIEALARAKGVNAPYVSRDLRLTLLAPEIVEAILDALPCCGWLSRHRSRHITGRLMVTAG